MIDVADVTRTVTS